MKVEFQVIKAPADQSEELLEDIGFTDIDFIISNLEKMGGQNKQDYRKYEHMVDKLENNEVDDIYFLVISDYNTYGLDGDDHLSLEVESRFQGYNYKLGISDKGSGLGMFGEGRMAAIYASDLQYVYQVSNLEEKWHDYQYRTFGLGIHGLFQDENNKIFNGIFFSCDPDGLGRVKSLMSNVFPDDNLLVPRERKNHTGTTFIFPFFDVMKFIPEEKDEENKEYYIDSFLEQVKLKAIETFFPSIAENLLEVTAEFIDLENPSTDLQSFKVDAESLPSILNQITTNSSDSSDEYYIVNEINDRIKLKIPRGKNKTSIIEDLAIRFIEVREEVIPAKFKADISDLLNKVVCARNGMMIQLYDPGSKIFRLKSFIGLLNVRRDKNQIAHDFLRLSEPVKHNSWKTTNERLKTQYGPRSGSIAINGMFNQIAELISHHFGLESIEADEVPVEVVEELFEDFGLDELGYQTASRSTSREKNSNQVGENKEEENEDTDLGKGIKVNEPEGSKTLKKKKAKKLKTRTKKVRAKPQKKPQTINQPKPKENDKDLGKIAEIIVNEIEIHVIIENELRNDDEMIVMLNIEDMDVDIKNIKISSNAVSKDGKVNIRLNNSIINSSKDNLKNKTAFNKNDFPINLKVDLKRIPSRLWKTVRVEFSGKGESA